MAPAAETRRVSDARPDRRRSSGPVAENRANARAAARRCPASAPDLRGRASPTSRQPARQWPGRRVFPRGRSIRAGDPDPPHPANSYAHHDFAEVLALLHAPERLRRFLQREGCIDNRLQIMLRDRSVHRLESGSRANGDALYPDHWSDDRTQRDLRLVTRHKTDYAYESAERQRDQ